MDNVPTKAYWMGEDIDILPAEKLREIIRVMGLELEDSRKATLRAVQMGRMFAAARARL